MGLGELPDRLPPEPDEDAGPAVARLEPAVVDDARPAGERLQLPRPADLELGRDDDQPERALGTRLEALDADRRPQQAEVDVAVADRPGRRPRRVGRAERQLRRRAAGRLPRRGASPRRAAARP